MTAWRDRIVELRRVPASELIPSPLNWRRHPKAQREALRTMLDRVGYVDAVIARKTSDGLVLIDGHLRADLDPAADRDFTIPITFTPAGGNEAADYAVAGLTSGALAVTKGDSSAVFTITGNADADTEDESVTISFGSSLPSEVSSGTPASATVTIVDDDRLIGGAWTYETEIIPGSITAGGGVAAAAVLRAIFQADEANLLDLSAKVSADGAIRVELADQEASIGWATGRQTDSFDESTTLSDDGLVAGIAETGSCTEDLPTGKLVCETRTGVFTEGRVLYAKYGAIPGDKTIEFHLEDAFTYTAVVNGKDSTESVNEYAAEFPSATLTVVEPANKLPSFTEGDATTRSVAEDTPPNQNVGDPVAATDPDNDPLTYSLGGTDAASFTVATDSGQLSTLVELDSDTKSSYSVTMSVHDGKDAFGDADNSIDDTITIHIIEVSPPDLPANFSADALNGRVWLSWEDPQDDTITKWRYWVRKAGDAAIGWRDIPDSGPRTTGYMVEGLENGQTYNFRLRAVSGELVGAQTRPAIPATPNPGTVPEDIYTATLTVRQHFAFLGFNTRGGSADYGSLSPDSFTYKSRDYTIDLLRYQGNELTLNTEPSLPDSALPELTLYLGSTEFPLSSSTENNNNSRGWSDHGLSWSDGEKVAVRITSPVPAPNKVVGLTAEAGHDRAKLSWIDPEDDTITGYQYQQNAGEWTDIPDSGAATLSSVVTGLTNGTAYSFKVRAVDSQTQGPASEAASVTPQAITSTPAKPQGLSAQPGLGTVTLSWDDPMDFNISGYQYIQNGGDWQDMEGSGHATTSHTFLGLAAGSQYAFAIRALNAVGASDTSDTVTAIMDNTAPVLGTAPTDLSLTENQPSGTSVGSVFTATDADADAGQTLTFSLTGADAGSFSIETTATAPDSGSGAEGQLKTAAEFDHETKDSYSLTVRVSDGGGGEATVDVTVTVTQLDAPTHLLAIVDIGRVKLRWKDPQVGTITGYQYTSDGGVNWNSIPMTNLVAVLTTRIPGRAAFEYAVTGLTSDNEYTFQVRAVAGAATGPSSAAVTATPLVAEFLVAWWESDPEHRDRFLVDEGLNIGMDSSGTIIVSAETGDNTPRLALTVGTETRYADLYYAGSYAFKGVAHTLLEFYYEIQPSDRDHDGVTIGPDSLELNGATMLDPDGNPVPLTLPEDIINAINGPAYRVGPDPLTVDFAADTWSGEDGGPDVVITVTVDPRGHSNFAVPIVLAGVAPSEGITEAEDGDYEVIGLNSSNQLEFTKGQTRAMFRIRLPVESDATDTDNEGLQITFGDQLPVDVSAGGQDQAVLIIYEVETVALAHPNQRIASVLPNAPVTIRAPGDSRVKLEFPRGSTADQPFQAKVDFDIKACGTGPSGRSLAGCTEVTLFDLDGLPVSSDEQVRFAPAVLVIEAGSGDGVTVHKRSGPGAAWTALPACRDAAQGAECYQVLSEGFVEVRNITSFSQYAQSRLVVPGAPSGLRANAGNGRVGLIWVKPGSIGPGITGYDYSQDGGVSWRRIPSSNANTTSYTVTGLTNNREYRFAVRARSSAEPGGRSNIVTATPQQPRSSRPSSGGGGGGGGGGGVSYIPPSFAEGAAITRQVAENSRAGTRVGGPVTATETRGRQITYSIAGADAALFEVASRTGQILLARSVVLDFEKGRRTYIIDVVARSSVGATARTTITINVTNVDEPGVVTLSPSAIADIGAAITAALSDPDGGITGQAWQWQRSTDGVTWMDIPAATSEKYTPVAEDTGLFLRVLVTYNDVLGAGLAMLDTAVAVSARPAPVATPPAPPTARPLPTVTPTPTVVQPVPTLTPPPGIVALRPTPMPLAPTTETVKLPTPMPTRSTVPVPEKASPTSTPVTVSTSPTPAPSALPTSTPVTAVMVAPEPTVAAATRQPEPVVPAEGGGFPVWAIVILGLLVVVALAAVGLMVRRARLRRW